MLITQNYQESFVKGNFENILDCVFIEIVTVKVILALVSFELTKYKNK
jgi:hypothetical protein